jgi:hypothetical protein
MNRTKHRGQMERITALDAAIYAVGLLTVVGLALGSLVVAAVLIDDYLTGRTSELLRALAAARMELDL